MVFVAIAFLLIALWITDAVAASPTEIMNDNARAIVFVQKLDEHNQEIMSGSGAIVSHDGYIITANHLAPKAGEKLIAVIGQRVGTIYPLEFRDEDKMRDLALWQLPQASSCRASVTISDKPFDESQNLVAIGFPGNRGLSRAILHVTNPHTPLGFYASDGAVEEGYSGGPVFDEGGYVIGLVQGGTVNGAKSNDIVPIAAAVAMLKKLGVSAAVGKSVPYPNNCYIPCRAPEHGIESWSHEESWAEHSGRMNGGNGETSMCNGMIAAKLAVSPPGSRIDLDPGAGQPGQGMWETSDKDVFGHVTYVYYCKGTLRSGPVYKEMRSPACPVWE